MEAWAVIWGVIATLSTCKVSTNAAAIAYVNRQTDGAPSIAKSYGLALAYIMSGLTCSRH